MSHHLDTLLDAPRRAQCARNDRALAAGQALWDAAEPEPDDIRERDAALLRRQFAAAMAGDANAPASFSWSVIWLARKRATAADLLRDALEDSPELMQRAMCLLVEAAKEGECGAQELIEQAGREWSEQHA